MRSTRPESGMPLRMHLMVLIGFLALIGAIAMLVNGSSLRTGFATSGSIGLPDASSSESVLVGHITTGINASTNYDSTVLQHASVEGPDRTRLVPKEWIHQGNPTYSDVTTYWGGKWVHVNYGPRKTEYIDLEDWAHITVGPRATDLISTDYHLEAGPDATSFDPTAGGTLTHVTVGGDKTKYVPLDFHVPTGPYMTAYAYHSWPLSSAHITSGSNETLFLPPDMHQSTGADKSKRTISNNNPSPSPESRPTPAPPSPPIQ